MVLPLLMSKPPVRNIKINLFLTRINICVSYILVIFGVSLQHDREKVRSCDIGCVKKKRKATSIAIIRTANCKCSWEKTSD